MADGATPAGAGRVKIIFVRHGSTKLNATTSAECIRGWLDVPLSPEGVKEAEATAEKLKEHDFDLILCSDLKRAEHTGEIISKATGVPIYGVSRGLRPWDVGDHAGRKVEDCLHILVDHIKNKPSTKMPNGESFDDFKNRFLNALDEIRRKYAGKTVALVSHHRNERLLAGWKMSGGGKAEDIKPDAFFQKGVPPAGFVRHTLAAGSVADDDDDDDGGEGSAPTKKRKAAAPKKLAPSGQVPQKARPMEKLKRPIKDDGLVKRDPFDLNPRPVKRAIKDDGLVKRDPFDLKPRLPIAKTVPTWESAVKGSLLER